MVPFAVMEQYCGIVLKTILLPNHFMAVFDDQATEAVGDTLTVQVEDVTSHIFHLSSYISKLFGANQHFPLTLRCHLDSRHCQHGESKHFFLKLYGLL